MIGAAEFNNLISQLPELIELAKKFNLDAISLIKPLPHDKVKLIVIVSQTNAVFGLDKCAKINVQFSKLLGIDINNDSIMVLDRQSFDTEKYNKHYKPNELLILTKDSEETFTTSPEKIKDFAKRILNIDYSLVDADSESLTQSKGEKRKFSTTTLSQTTKPDKVESSKSFPGNLFSNNDPQQQQNAKIDRLVEEVDQLSDEELDQLVKRSRLNNMKSLLQEKPNIPLIKSGK